MERGKWYLVTKDLDNMENHCPDAESKIEISTGNGLASEKVAIAKAQEIWRNRQSYTGWDNETYPKRPRLIFEIVLDEK